jgi:hypothetical protein
VNENRPWFATRGVAPVLDTEDAGQKGVKRKAGPASRRAASAKFPGAASVAQRRYFFSGTFTPPCFIFSIMFFIPFSIIALVSALCASGLPDEPP